MPHSLLSDGSMLKWWLVLFVVVGIGTGVVSGFFKARKIQPRGFKWRTFRNEIVFAVINVVISGTILQFTTKTLLAHGWISMRHEAAPWWVIALEFALYFFAFDTWFYWLHRLMHIEPIYKWVHKLHHWSTAPNLVTTFSVSPLESLINGGFVPLFLLAFHVHPAAFALIAPTNVIMGIYVHSGYEFFPRWWHKSWATKWFITTTFHDQHHRYFTCNFGGYTTIWDRICGTVRPKFDADWAKLKARLDRPHESAEAAGGAPA